MNDYDKLNNELRQAGVPDHEFMFEKTDPMDTLVNTNMSSRPFSEILLKYLSILTGNEQEMVVRVLAEKENKEAIPFLEKILADRESTPDHVIWATEFALKRIKRK
jgi:HEAT repeat protein